LTFSEEAFVADQRGSASRLVVEIRRLINDEKYESIPDKVEELVGMEPAIIVTGHDLGMEAALSKAEKEIAAGKFGNAEDIYEEAILTYYRSGKIDDAKVVFYQMMVDWAGQLREEANYQSAMTVYKRILAELDTVEKSDPEFVRLIGQNYMDLADQYSDKANYQAALETLLEFTGQYPTANFTSALRARFPDIYLRLARQQLEGKEYADAATNFETVMANYPGTMYAANAKAEIVDAYLGLGDQLAEDGKDQEAYDVYMKAIALNISDAEKARVSLALGGILLNIAKDQLSMGDYIDAELSLREAKGYAQDEDLKSEISNTLNVVITSLADNTGNQGQQVLSEAVANACSGQKATSDAVNFHRDQDGKAMSCTATFTLPPDLVASTPGELRYVVTVESGTEELAACSRRYYSYYGSFSYTLYRARYRKTVTIRSAESGDVYESRSFYGSYPGSCPYSYYFSTFGKTYLYGGQVNDDEITNWLEWKIK
jgi:tetratricopeptide (TPR) repeat protein